MESGLNVLPDTRHAMSFGIGCPLLAQSGRCVCHEIGGLTILMLWSRCPAVRGRCQGPLLTQWEHSAGPKILRFFLREVTSWAFVLMSASVCSASLAPPARVRQSCNRWPHPQSRDGRVRQWSHLSVTPSDGVLGDDHYQYVRNGRQGSCCPPA